MKNKRFMASVTGPGGGFFDTKPHTSIDSAVRSLRRSARRYGVGKGSTKRRTLRVRDLYSNKKDNVVLERVGTYQTLLLRSGKQSK